MSKHSINWETFWALLCRIAPLHLDHKQLAHFFWLWSRFDHQRLLYHQPRFGLDCLEARKVELSLDHQTTHLQKLNQSQWSVLSSHSKPHLALTQHSSSSFALLLLRLLVSFVYSGRCSRIWGRRETSLLLRWWWSSHSTSLWDTCPHSSHHLS